ncbi:MAG: short-chain fatty acid transporter [Candidatus Acidiferrales bacterium]
MLNRIARFFVGVSERWMPDPFLFCILLTAATYLLALGLTPAGPVALAQHWFNGLWTILPFAMQMILILLTGYALASSRPVRRLLERIASIPRTQSSAIVILTLASALAALVNWGFALVASALLAREMGRRVPNCDFGFLVAGAYSGFVIWHSGLSGSIPLVSATAGSELNFIANHTGVAVTQLAQTIGLPLNLTLVAGTLIGLPLMFWLMQPRGKQVRPADPALLAEKELDAEADADKPRTPAEKLEGSRAVLLLLIVLGAAFLGHHFYTRGFDLNLNVVILLFLLLGMALHARPAAYVRAFNQAARVAGPLALQYPLYGGIMGMMADSGLGAQISNWFVSISTATTFPVFCFWSAALVNLFVPSGGGQWAVQGPIMIPAGLELGVRPEVTAMAVAFGDQNTNMLQPFWALPILSVARLSVRDIMGYCVMTFLLSAALSTLVLWLLV